MINKLTANMEKSGEDVVVEFEDMGQVGTEYLTRLCAVFTDERRLEHYVPSILGQTVADRMINEMVGLREMGISIGTVVFDGMYLYPEQSKAMG